ncbi:heme-binding domain-containing protein [Ekhidna sp. MALMAid0563]|uniref:heme-binding domain-containing protein n=1 Tax=Ekhidna sp. MALMAid0563 TaxID=3143937 RepID=UPI0032DED1C6
MKKYIKPALLILLGAFIILQFFRGTPPEVRTDNPNDIIAHEVIDAEVATLLRNACYDCHSMESNYPWYTYITPLSWWIFEHVEHGREELNFSEWASFSMKRKLHKLEEISEETLEGEMPLESYTPVHAEAQLTDEQRQLISDWALGMVEKAKGN